MPTTTARDDLSIDAALYVAELRRHLPAPHIRKQLREDVGVAQATVSRALGGLAVGVVSRWESGEREPSDRLLPGYLAILRRFAIELAERDESERAT